MHMRDAIPAIQAYFDDAPTPMTAAMVATAMKIDPDLAARCLASMTQRPNPLIARQPVSPERRSANVKFEYMSLAMAKKLGVKMSKFKYQSKKEPKQVIPFIPDSSIPNGILLHDINPVVELTKPTELPIIEDMPQPPMPGVEALARLIGRRIARTMMQALQEEVEEQLEQISNSLIEKWVDEKARPMIHRTSPLQEKERLPKVLIAGLLPSQAGQIKAEFGEVFDLDFYMTDENLKHLHDKLRGKVDHFFTFTSKVEHAAEGFAKQHGIKINRSSGGMTMLRRKLEELYVNGVVA